jgi:hypothetical protein
MTRGSHAALARVFLPVAVPRRTFMYRDHDAEASF